MPDVPMICILRHSEDALCQEIKDDIAIHFLQTLGWQREGGNRAISPPDAPDRLDPDRPPYGEQTSTVLGAGERRSPIY
jgi:hypothetical protein